MAKIYGGRWQIDKKLGEGGQAHTFLVKDLKENGDTRYVLKRLKNVDRLARFEREVKVVKSSSHENIVRFIDFDLENDKPYLVTEYCSGESLDRAVPFWQGQPILALQLFKQICEGVTYAHAKDIIHRDIKPANIFLRKEKGPAVVGDFGICYIVETDGTRLTSTKEAVGARYYIAPELEDGRVDVVQKESDIYSLGKVLYWLLSGKIFSREQHRVKKWDLRGWNENANGGFGDWDNILMEHVNRILLDRMILHEPNGRFSISSILLLIETTIRLIQKEYNPIAKDIPRPPCNYCGDGYYVLRAKSDDTEKLRNFGINPMLDADWRVLVCSSCGHVQTFRIEQAENREWWD